MQSIVFQTPHGGTERRDPSAWRDQTPQFGETRRHGETGMERPDPPESPSRGGGEGGGSARVSARPRAGPTGGYGRGWGGGRSLEGEDVLQAGGDGGELLALVGEGALRLRHHGRRRLAWCVSGGVDGIRIRKIRHRDIYQERYIASGYISGATYSVIPCDMYPIYAQDKASDVVVQYIYTHLMHTWGGWHQDKEDTASGYISGAIHSIGIYIRRDGVR
jgi:hypothetical protein